jgi:hypothetical protein
MLRLSIEIALLTLRREASILRRGLEALGCLLSTEAGLLRPWLGALMLLLLYGSAKALWVFRRRWRRVILLLRLEL